MSGPAMRGKEALGPSQGPGTAPCPFLTLTPVQLLTSVTPAMSPASAAMLEMQFTDKDPRVQGSQVA